MKYKLYIEPDELSKAMNESGRDYVRELVRQRDGRKCRSCGKQWKPGMRRLDVHHLNGLCGKKSMHYDKVSEVSDLITLCHRCHYNHPEHSKRLDGTYNSESRHEVARLIKEGYTKAAISKGLGVSHQRVSQLARECGIPARPRTKRTPTAPVDGVALDKDMLASLLKEGQTQAAIARHFGVPNGYIHYLVKKYGVRTGSLWDVIKNGPLT